LLLILDRFAHRILIGYELSLPKEHHARTKHLDLRIHNYRELVKYKYIILEQISTTIQHADFLTKPLAKPTFEFHYHAVINSGMISLPTQSSSEEGGSDMKKNNSTMKS
jgi:hypothetical protein